MKIAQLNNIRIYSPTSSSALSRQFLRFPGGFRKHMNEDEALRILNIQGDDIANLTQRELKRRHHRLMIQNHPDKNGSKFLAAKVNEAKQVLEESFMFKK